MTLGLGVHDTAKVRREIVVSVAVITIGSLYPSFTPIEPPSVVVPISGVVTIDERVTVKDEGVREDFHLVKFVFYLFLSCLRGKIQFAVRHPEIASSICSVSLPASVPLTVALV